MSPNTERKYREALKVEGLLFGCKELPDLETLRLAVESQVERSSPPEQWRPVYETPFIHGRLDNPRFVRSVDEIIGEEVHDERP